ncbi:hypothetical protein [Agromyces seonyuensis]|uniref:Uncharacterized protein n=1 Tax=Agromyces seonyuensis TaxID=2662446 RepID=A0A6I4P2N2_9MICO|nr:hypothetical protein [Agromyces seonyuensis]MWB99005.1 hypothetical protein [Agromyces seonyuensis]
MVEQHDERATRGSGSVAGDAAVIEATGRSRDDWFGMLDADGALEWKHGRIAARLADHYDVDPWWAQHVTVAYEQARGLRRPGQRPDGTFEFAVSRTVRPEGDADPAAVHAALDALVAVVAADLGTEPVSRSGAAVKHPTARWPLAEGALLATASAASIERISLGLTRSGLADDAGIPDEKARLRALLAAVAPGTVEP